MEFIFGILAFGVIGIIIFCFIMYCQEAIPHKLDEIMAKDEMERFQNSEAANYASAKIAQTFGDIIAEYPRYKTEEKLEFSCSFSVSPSEVSSCFCNYKFVECDFRMWYYDFDEHRYPRLERSAERTALGSVIANRAIAMLKNRFPKDVSGSEDISFSCSKFLGYNDTKITIYYKASNACYEELKSW